jgi:hypothetical protein
VAPTGVGGKVCQTHGPHGPHGSPNGRRQGRGVCVYILSIYVSQRLTITSLSRPSARHCKQVYCTALRHIPYDPTITRLNMAPGLSSTCRTTAPSGGSRMLVCAAWPSPSLLVSPAPSTAVSGGRGALPPLWL